MELYLARPNHIVIAALRDPTSACAKALASLPTAENVKLILLKLDSSSDTDATTAVETLKTDYSITKLNIVIANAGISNYYGPAVTTSADVMRKHFQINTLAPLLLFTAVQALLDAAENPRFVVVSSLGGSISILHENPLPSTAYHISKAGVNCLSRKLHVEHPNIIVFPIEPGWVPTDVSLHSLFLSG